MEQHLSPQVIASKLGIHEDTVYKACTTGKLKYVRVGKRIRIAESDAWNWLRTRNNTSTK